MSLLRALHQHPCSPARTSALPMSQRVLEALPSSQPPSFTPRQPPRFPQTSPTLGLLPRLSPLPGTPFPQPSACLTSSSPSTALNLPVRPLSPSQSAPWPLPTTTSTPGLATYFQLFSCFQQHLSPSNILCYLLIYNVCLYLSLLEYKLLEDKDLCLACSSVYFKNLE